MGIYWRRQDNAVLPTNSSVYKGTELVFPSVTRKHRGTYYCVATNVVGTGARRNIDVEVEHTPSIKIPRKRLGQALQFNTILRAVTIEKNQYGRFICEATNRLGSSNATVELFETVIPICPPACDEVNYSSGALPLLLPPLLHTLLLSLLLLALHHR